jgi:hypothetical protein
MHQNYGLQAESGIYTAIAPIDSTSVRMAAIPERSDHSPAIINEKRRPH